MKKLWFPFLVVVFCILVFSVDSFAGDKEKTLDFPFPHDTGQLKTNNLFCTAIIGSMIQAAAEDSMTMKKGIRGELFKGTDKISIKIDEDKLYLLTKASFEIGDTKDIKPLLIIQNDDSTMTAIDIDKAADNVFINVFSLNKNTGIAIWSKSRSSNLFTNHPDVQSYCLKCLPR